jgi:hypothetical protein
MVPKGIKEYNTEIKHTATMILSFRFALPYYGYK